jgi:hypothetical protein
VAAGYAVVVLFRLARYAAAVDAGTSHGFTGLPAPPAAMAAVALVVLHLAAPLALAAFTVLAGLMAATFPFPRIDAATAPLMAVWWGSRGSLRPASSARPAAGEGDGAAPAPRRRRAGYRNVAARSGSPAAASRVVTAAVA